MVADAQVTSPEWSFDAEIVGFVDMAKAQITVAMREAEAPVAELGEVIAEVGALARRALQALQATPDAGAASDAAIASITGIGDRLSAASVALQFHDRLVQRLCHASEALDVLSGAVADRHRHHSRADWDRLRQSIRARYSMEHERVIFDLLVGGASPEHVLDMLKSLRDNGGAGHVDLF